MLKVVIEKDTVAKPSLNEASTIDPRQLVKVKRNQVFLVENYLIANHYKLHDRELYLYAPHCSVVEVIDQPWLQTALTFIANFEGFRPHAYYLPGEPTWTIGYGTTRIAGVPVKAGDKITQPDALELLRLQVLEFAAKVQKLLPNWKDLNSNQCAAIVSFAYNVGIDGFSKSSVRRDVLAGKDPRQSLGLWVKGSNKQVMWGLVKRRNAEADLFNSK